MLQKDSIHPKLTIEQPLDAGHFVELLMQKWQYGRRRLLFRGQANFNWNLEPSLDRMLRGISANDDRLRIEENLRQDFEENVCHMIDRRAQEYLQVVQMTESGGIDKDVERLRRLTVMQHYGYPTCLLDWTFCPLVAALTASLGESDWDGVVVPLRWTETRVG
jgi:hypothetical protein